MHLTLPILTCLLSWQFAPSTLTLLWNYDAAGNQSLFRNFLLEVDSQVELTSLTLLPYVELLEALCQGPRNAAQVSPYAMRSRCKCPSVACKRAHGRRCQSVFRISASGVLIAIGALNAARWLMCSNGLDI